MQVLHSLHLVDDDSFDLPFKKQDNDWKLMPGHVPPELSQRGDSISGNNVTLEYFFGIGFHFYFFWRECFDFAIRPITVKYVTEEETYVF